MRSPTISRVVKPESEERRAADEGIECIGCGICHSACDVVAWDADYLGPAALNRAWTLVNDVRDRAQAERLDAVAGDVGLPRVPHAYELHHLLPQGDCADLFHRRVEARGGRSAPCGGGHDGDAVPSPARERRRAGARGHGASRDHRLRGARRADGGRDPRAHRGQRGVSRVLCRVCRGGRGSRADRACATCCANGCGWQGRACDAALAVFALVLFALGVRAVLALYLA